MQVNRRLQGGGTKATPEKLGIAEATQKGVLMEVKVGLLGGRGSLEESVNKGQGVEEVEGLEVGIDWGFDLVDSGESVGEDERVRQRGGGPGADELEQVGGVGGGGGGGVKGVDRGALESIYQPQDTHPPSLPRTAGGCATNWTGKFSRAAGSPTNWQT